MPKEALAAFEATLKKEPNRLDAYVGAARAAEKSGDSAKAREYYGKVVAIASDADKTRADIAKLAELQDKLSQAKDAYWAEQVKIQGQIATAWVLYAEGKRDEALLP